MGGGWVVGDANLMHLGGWCAMGTHGLSSATRSIAAAASEASAATHACSPVGIRRRLWPRTRVRLPLQYGFSTGVAAVRPYLGRHLRPPLRLLVDVVEVPCVARDADMGRQSAGGNSSAGVPNWSPGPHAGQVVRAVHTAEPKR